MGEQEERAAFESFVGGPPFEYSVARFPNDPARFSWPGNYRNLAVDLAWHAWQKRAAATPLPTHPQQEKPKC